MPAHPEQAIAVENSMEIRIPEVGESIVEALVATWHKQNGELVLQEEPVCELETDKVTLEINAAASGTLSILVPAGQTVKIGTVIGIIREASVTEAKHPPLSPAARKLAREKAVSPQDVTGTGKKGRILVEDLFAHGTGPEASPKTIEAPESVADTPLPATTEQAPANSAPAKISMEPPPAYTGEMQRSVTRKPLSPIRKRITERLTDARRQTATVTTFNEADMGRIIALRRKYQDHFSQKHGVSLGLMSFFVKACVEALKEFPDLNASIDGDDIVYHHYYDMGIAVSGEKGLVTPVLRHADRLHLAEIEQAIDSFVAKVREHRLEIADLEGGTFTISNGGVFGSLLSTPLLNPPQSATLGMHVIQERPVALLGKVVIRPMMNLALSYDHRIIDGREAVGFLKKVKEYVEEPEEVLLEG
jgi:2-oxoglutarate dehydrogenase E2 component (dihydrolipoamide succinyltransferase)